MFSIVNLIASLKFYQNAKIKYLFKKYILYFSKKKYTSLQKGQIFGLSFKACKYF